MKKILLILFWISMCVLFGSSEQKKLEVIGEVRGSQIYYAGMDKILPDSTKLYFVKLDKKARLNDLGIVNYLTLNG